MLQRKSGMTCKLTLILPYFNEEGWIGKTIDSLAAQTERGFELLLVDNASTDASTEEARRHCGPLGDAVSFMVEPVPGKTNAMATGLEAVRTPYVAICDADTIYPPDYVRSVITLFERNPQAVAVMAIDLYETENGAAERRIRKIMGKARRYPAKCHAGGYAQAFRTDALRRCGGFNSARWPHVLEDHEVAYRVMRHGKAIYSADHVCFPSTRRACRKAVHWTHAERLLYKVVPTRFLGWYFYRFLAPSLARRKCCATSLRTKSWRAPPRRQLAPEGLR